MVKGLARSLGRGTALQAQIIKQSVSLVGLTVDITGGAGVVDPGEIFIAGLPEGNILLLGAVVSDLIVSAVDADVLIDWAGDFGIGTIPNADADLGDAGDDDIIASTALLADTGTKATLAQRAVSTQSEHALIIDNTAGALELNFNLLVDDNFITDAAVGTFTLLQGRLDLAYIMLGDD